MTHQLPDDPLLPAGQVTLAGYAKRIGRHERYLLSFLDLPGFPDPVGELPGRGRHGGGRRRKVYTEASLDTFRAGQQHLHGQAAGTITTSLGRDEQVTLGFFADHAEWDSGGRPSRKTIAQHRDQPGFPAAGPDGRYRAGDLIAYFASRPGKRGPGRERRRVPAAAAGRPSA